MPTDGILTIQIDSSELDHTIERLQRAIVLQRQLSCPWWCPVCAAKRWWHQPTSEFTLEMWVTCIWAIGMFMLGMFWRETAAFLWRYL